MSLLFHDYTKARTSTTSPGGKQCCPNQQHRRKELKPSHPCRISGVPHRAGGIVSSAARDPPTFTVLESTRAPPSTRLRHADVPLCCHLLDDWRVSRRSCRCPRTAS
jgi:hypothetical protein